MKSATQVEPYRVYLKGELGAYSACKMEHSDCSTPDEYCVAAPYYLGSRRQCLTIDQIGEAFGCTTGSLIIRPAEPYQLDCM